MLRKEISKEDLELIAHKGPNQRKIDIILGNDHPSKFAPTIYGFFTKETRAVVEYRANEANYIRVPRIGK